MSKLRFGDFTGDGVTDVLAVENGRWAISESARKPWRELNHHLHDPVANLFIANMDQDDNIDDILRYEVKDDEEQLGRLVIWWRSKNGVEPWERFAVTLSSHNPNNPFQTSLLFGFVGHFRPLSGGTLTVDYDRIGHFQILGARPELSLFPY